MPRQLDRFGERHPDVHVELRVTPDAADQRHQLYVRWLNARAPESDVLQFDIPVTIQPPIHTIAPLVDAIVAYCADKH